MGDDLGLIQMAVKGNGNAFNELWSRHYPMFGRVMFRMGVPNKDVEDLLQEFSLKLWTTILPRFDPEKGKWTTFACNKLVLMCRDYLRRRARGLATVSLEAIPDQPAEGGDESSEVTEKLEAQAKLWADVQECKDQLNSEYQKIFSLRYQGLTWDEISCMVFPKKVAERRQKYADEMKAWEAQVAAGSKTNNKPRLQLQNLSKGKFDRALNFVRDCLRSKGHFVPVTKENSKARPQDQKSPE